MATSELYELILEEGLDRGQTFCEDAVQIVLDRHLGGELVPPRLVLAQGEDAARGGRGQLVDWQVGTRRCAAPPCAFSCREDNLGALV